MIHHTSCFTIGLESLLLLPPAAVGGRGFSSGDNIRSRCLGDRSNGGEMVLLRFIVHRIRFSMIRFKCFKCRSTMRMRQSSLNRRQGSSSSVGIINSMPPLFEPLDSSTPIRTADNSDAHSPSRLALRKSPFCAIRFRMEYARFVVAGVNDCATLLLLLLFEGREFVIVVVSCNVGTTF